MTIETLCGIVLVALPTGLMFARVSRPTARVRFRKAGVVTTYNGAPTLMVRMENERLSQIVQAEVGMTLVRNERTAEGTLMRRFYDLRLERDRTSIFAMSYMAMHTLGESSPLFGVTGQTLDDMEAEILVTGIVTLSGAGSPTGAGRDWWDEAVTRPSLSSSLSRGDHQSRSLAVSRVQPEPPGR